MTTNTNEQIFASLTEDQKKLVEGCDNSVVYLGETQEGPHTYFFELEGDGYTSLPEAPEGEGFPVLDLDHTVIQVGQQKWFDFEGKEFLPPPFQYLVHVDLRKWNEVYMRNAPYIDPQHEESILIGCGGGCCLPERAAKVVGVEKGALVPWATNFWICPWELTEELMRACVAVTAVYPDGRRVALL